MTLVLPTSEDVSRLVNTISANVRELAALTVLGSCEPPAPSDAMAPQIPGARKEQPPSTVIWKNVERNQLGFWPLHATRASGLGSRSPRVSSRVALVVVVALFSSAAMGVGCSAGDDESDLLSGELLASSIGVMGEDMVVGEPQ